MNFTNDTKIAQDGSLIGDPTETALVQFGLDHAFNVTEKVALNLVWQRFLLTLIVN